MEYPLLDDDGLGELGLIFDDCGVDPPKEFDLLICRGKNDMARVMNDFLIAEFHADVGGFVRIGVGSGSHPDYFATAELTEVTLV